MSILENSLTTQQVAEMLGVSERTVRNYCKDKLITHYKIGGKITIEKKDVDEFITRHVKVEAKKENEEK